MVINIIGEDFINEVEEENGAMTNTDIQAFLENLNNHWQNPAWDHETATKILAQVSFVHIPTMLNQMQNAIASAGQLTDHQMDSNEHHHELITRLENMNTSLVSIQDSITKDHRLILFQLEKANRPWWKELFG